MLSEEAAKTGQWPDGFWKITWMCVAKTVYVYGHGSGKCSKGWYLNMVEGNGHVGARFEGGRKHSSCSLMEEAFPRTQTKKSHLVNAVLCSGVGMHAEVSESQRV